VGLASQITESGICTEASWILFGTPQQLGIVKIADETTKIYLFIF
jgi:hypothetical protein